MMSSCDRRVQLFRMEEARRQTQHQLDLIDRQITRRMTALIPGLKPKRTAYRAGKPPDPGTFLERYRGSLAAITSERQPVARQDRAIIALRAQLSVFDHGQAAADRDPGITLEERCP